VALVHLALVGLVFGGLRVAAKHDRETVEPIISIRLDPPPPPEAPAKQPAPDPPGAAGKRAKATPVVAPPAPRIAASPVIAAPVAGAGNAATAGAAAAGDGSGAGGSGSGTGGGGGRPARWISGGLRDSDYPRQALRDRVSGNVSVRFTVLASGAIARCRVVRSSGSAILDSTTCRLLEQRLRFAPATDGAGQAVESELGSDYGWGIRRR
jgi:protein TonB